MSIEFERSAAGIDLAVLNISDTDLARAAPDAIAVHGGYAPRAPHPLAADLKGHTLATIAAHFGGLVNTNNPHHTSKALVNGLSSIGFKTIIEKTARRIVEKAYQRDDTLNRIARPLPQENFKANLVSSVTMHRDLEQTQEGGERPLLMGKVSDNETNKVGSWGLAILIQRRDVINNDQVLIAQLFAEAAQLAQRHELKKVIAYLESNPELPELDSKGGSSRDWFTVDDGNLVAGDLRKVEGLDAAFQTMRNQTAANGDRENIQPRFILASPKHEIILNHMIHDAGLELDVIVHPDISDDHYFALADPARQPAVGVQFIGPPDAREIRTWSISQVRKLPIEYDGLGYTLDVDLAPTAISRKGIVRVELN